MNVALYLCALLFYIAIQASAEPAKVVHLFNRRNLDGFYTFIKDRGRDQDPKEVFTVSKGLLRVSGEEWGCLTSEQEFENYRLVAEFKWGTQTSAPRTNNARDSGIPIHSTGEDGAFDGTWMYSIECQIIEGGTGDILVVGDGSGRYSATSPVAPELNAGSHVYLPGGAPVTINKGRINWFGRDPQWSDPLGFRGRQDVEKPPGKWNRLEVIADGSAVTVILNGVNYSPADRFLRCGRPRRRGQRAPGRRGIGRGVRRDGRAVSHHGRHQRDGD